MPSLFEVFTKCPNTGELVNTGAKVAKPVFGNEEKPHGGFSCPSCNESHFWSFKDGDVRILEVHR